MTRYPAPAEQRFPELIRELLQRVGALESRTNALGTTNSDGSVVIPNLVTVAHAGGGSSLTYAGAPALNTLLLSISGTAGVDIYGNSYPQGIGVWDGAGTLLGKWGSAGLVASPLGSLLSPQLGVTPLVADTWHVASLNAGFGAPGGILLPPAYQAEAVNGGRVRLRGQATLTGTVGSGTTIFTLGTHYLPAHEQQLVAGNTLSGASGQAPVLGVDTSGNVQVLVGGASGNRIRFDNVVFPLD